MDDDEINFKEIKFKIRSLTDLRELTAQNYQILLLLTAVGFAVALFAAGGYYRELIAAYTDLAACEASQLSGWFV